jgi:hypothetical protein
MTGHSDMPPADATVLAHVDRARARVRTRAIVAGAGEGGKIPRVLVTAVADVRADACRWWLYTSRPPSLKTWNRTLKVGASQVPGDSTLLRRAWTVDNHTTGRVFRYAATGLQLAAAGLAWLACTPARRWFALLIVAVFTAPIVIHSLTS